MERMMSQSLIVKVDFEGDIRRLTCVLNQDDCAEEQFEALSQAVREGYDMSNGQPLPCFKYQDAEGNYCTLKAASLRDCLALAGGGPVRLHAFNVQFPGVGAQYNSSEDIFADCFRHGYHGHHWHHGAECKGGSWMSIPCFDGMAMAVTHESTDMNMCTEGTHDQQFHHLRASKGKGKCNGKGKCKGKGKGKILARLKGKARGKGKWKGVWCMDEATGRDTDVMTNC